jgi:hypothetical protein
MSLGRFIRWYAEHLRRCYNDVLDILRVTNVYLMNNRFGGDI